MNEHGDVIIKIQFLEKISRTTLENFWNVHVIPLRFIEELPSVVLFDNLIFTHIQLNGVILLGTCCQDGSALISLEILSIISKVLNIYLKGLSEATLRDNFSLVYQLLQELLDYGYPFLTEIFALEELVPRPTLENKVLSILENPIFGKVVGNTTANANSRVWRSLQPCRRPWRGPTTKHTANEILFDVIERLDYIIDAEGHLIKTSVRGSIEVNCRLNGVPDIQLRLVNADTVDDAGFHRCVQHLKRRGDYTLSFVPPDGKFTMMEYTCRPQSAPALPALPFYVTPQVSFHSTGGRFSCMVGLRGGRVHGRDQEKEVQDLKVVVILPPRTTALTVTNCTMGSTSFERPRSVLTWSVGNVRRHSASLQGEFNLEPLPMYPEQEQLESLKDGTRRENEPRDRIPSVGANVLISFHIPNYSVSGLCVESVHILNEIGKPYKGVKYMTEGGSFLIRGF
ncbi:unnamed protein product [Phytomonas sp. Hart1]|nr:unnamed protein product [Phytomonas sp. Hart1]|eukprot:CCW66523.1 unnamed protein product [Phytomonas sp. isolate Hart1]